MRWEQMEKYAILNYMYRLSLAAIKSSFKNKDAQNTNFRNKPEKYNIYGTKHFN